MIQWITRADTKIFSFATCFCSKGLIEKIYMQFQSNVYLCIIMIALSI